MGLLKKHLTFSIVVVVCLFVFVAGAYLAYSESGKIGKAKQQIRTAEKQLDNLRFADPAPSEENVRASKQNVEELVAELTSIRKDLERGSRLTTSTDGIGVMAGIQQYITDFQRKAAEHLDMHGESDPIELSTDFAFGFEQYVKEATPFDDEQVVAMLDKQRQILEYLLNKLYNSDPASIVSVKREVLERKVAQAASGNSKSDSKADFTINPAVSARVPGAVDTLAFSLTFTGYTDSLRAFLNELAKFDLPIVVRSVEVERPSGAKTTVAPRANNLDAIFGAFGGGSEPDQKAPEEAQKPVISENTSTFTIVLEFIEIVLPADTAEDNV
jgi:hypothetical protein